MSRTHKDGRQYSKKERHISVRAVRRDPPDLRKLARAIAAVAIAQAEAQAQAKVDAMDAVDAADATDASVVMGVAPANKRPDIVPNVEPDERGASDD